MAGTLARQAAKLIRVGNKLSKTCPADDGCQFCTAATPSQVQVSLGSFVNATTTCTGTQCSALNGSYTLSQSTANPCFWSNDPSLIPCGQKVRWISLNVQGSRVVGSIQFYATSTAGGGVAGDIIFDSASTGWDHCHSWSTFTLSHTTESFGTRPCTPGTFKITTT